MYSRVTNYDIAHVEQGSGIPVIFVHGAGEDYRFWRHQISEFADVFRTMAISLRAYSPKTWNGDGNICSIAQHVDALAAFISGHCSGKVHLVGHSRGGHVSLRAAEKYPHLIEKLVLAEPAGAFGETHHQQIKTNPIMLLALKQLPPFSTATLHNITMPTLLVDGQNTQPVFRQILDVMQKAIPNPKRLTIAGAGHAMNRDNPAHFNKGVLQFLKNEPERGGSQI